MLFDNQELLSDNCKNDKHFDVSIATVEKLVDEDLLADIAENDEDHDVKRLVLRRTKS